MKLTKGEQYFILAIVSELKKLEKLALKLKLRRKRNYEPYLIRQTLAGDL